MALSLEQYAEWLDGRNLLWPEPPQIQKPKVRPHVPALPGIRAVSWSVYGTLLAIPGGCIWFEHPHGFVMTTALEKTIHEFRMWQSMTRKPGLPAENLLPIYRRFLERQQLRGTERRGVEPEVRSERIWEEIVKLLIKNGYHFDVDFYGSLNQYGQKIAFFFHGNLQPTSAYPEVLQTVRRLAELGYSQMLLANGQCFTEVQLLRALRKQGTLGQLGEIFDLNRSVLSYREGVRKPAEPLYRKFLENLAADGIEGSQVLHVGSRVSEDLTVAKRLGMRTALFAGDKASLSATREQLKERGTRPDLLVCDHSQLCQSLSRP